MFVQKLHATPVDISTAIEIIMETDEAVINTEYGRIGVTWDHTASGIITPRIYNLRDAETNIYQNFIDEHVSYLIVMSDVTPHKRDAYPLVANALAIIICNTINFMDDKYPTRAMCDALTEWICKEDGNYDWPLELPLAITEKMVGENPIKKTFQMLVEEIIDSRLSAARSYMQTVISVWPLTKVKSRLTMNEILTAIRYYEKARNPGI